MLKNRSLRELISSRSSAPGKCLWLICVALCAMASTVFSQGFGPLNDAFTNATLISGASGTISGFSFGATRETNEPVHYPDGQGSASVWFAWIAPDSGTAVFDTFGSSFDTLLAAYTGTDLTNLVQVAANDDEGEGLQSRINFSAESGKTYFIAVDGFQGASGSYTLSWQLPVLTTNNPPPNPGELQFSASSYAVNENVPGPGSITISMGSFSSKTSRGKP